jgi:hypothetical protein
MSCNDTTVHDGQTDCSMSETRFEFVLKTFQVTAFSKRSKGLAE